LKGFNIAVGGGLAMTHGNTNTYARLGTILGFTDTEEKTLKAVYEILTVQRDFGNREDRKLSRLKYTVDKMTVAGFKAELEKRIGFELLPEKAYSFDTRSDLYGWQQNHLGKWFYTLFVEHGVVKPHQKTMLYELAQMDVSNFIFTCNQNLILGEIEEKNKAKVQALIDKYAVENAVSALRKNSMACVALPSCPLALAEAQRYLPEMVTKIEPILEKYKLQNDEIVIRMTGCPNGCGRSHISEIGFIGTGPGQYNLMLGGDRLGFRLNQTYKEKLNEAQILTEVDSIVGQYVKEKNANETFGDFTYRTFFSK
jgi:sulfite reductase (NADPH) hemoprotein beta-component